MQFAAKKLDKRLLDLGATAIVEKGLGDDQHPAGYEFILCRGYPYCIHLTIVLSMALFSSEVIYVFIRGGYIYFSPDVISF